MLRNRTGSRVSTLALVLACVALLGPREASSQVVLGPQPISAPDQFFNSGDVRIRYVSVGSGEPIILIHGWSASAEMWVSAIQELSPDHRVIALDCRGHGKSGKPTDPKQYGMEMVNDVVRLMDHLGIPKAHIVGYSMGGSIVLKMLTTHPDRFLTVVVGGSSGFRLPEDFDTPETPLIKSLLSGISLTDALIANAPPSIPKPSPEQRARMEQMNANQDPKALAAQRLGNVGLKVDYDLLKKNTVPTLVVYGGNDDPIRFDALRAALANGEFKQITGAGHMAAAFSPEFAQGVRDFLVRHPAQSLAGALPDAPAPRLLATWLAAYNSGDRSELQAFYAGFVPSRLSSLDDEIMRRRNISGGYDLKKVESCEATACSAILEMRDLEQYVRWKIVLSSDGGQIIALDGQLVPRPPEFPSPRLAEHDAIAALGDRLRADSAADRFSGVVLVAKQGHPIFSEAYGLADRATQAPNTLQTRFRLGSMNKIFTAVAVLQLAEAGEIDLDAPLGKYITDYPNPAVASKVKVKHLLTHTGGTGDIFGPEYNAHRSELRTLQDYVRLYGTGGLEFEPGTNRAYSNYGFVLLGVLIERVSGQSYYDYVRDHIFLLAGMSRTDSEPEDTPVPGRAVAYTRMDGSDAWTLNRDTLPYRGTSAGGGYSTAEDLLRFTNALTTGKLLGPKYLGLLIHGEPLTPGGKSYSFGSGGRDWDGVRYFGHNGGFAGMNTDLEISLQSGYTIIVLANVDPPAAQRISEFIGSRLPQRAEGCAADSQPCVPVAQAQ